MATDKLLSIDELSVSFATPGGDVDAVRHISFDIGEGETVALVGESGSGKSVTALSVLQLLPYPVARHPSGSVRFQGDEVMGADEAALRGIRGNRISMIFQEPMSSLNPLHTVQKQIAETLILHKGLSEAEARARVLELLKLVGLANAEQRLTAYRAAFADAGVEYLPELVETGDFSFESGYEATRRILSRKLRPTAIIAQNDDMAVGAMSAARELGFDVPGDLSVVGFDDSEISRVVWPRLTTVRQPVVEMAHTAADMLLRELAGEEPGPTVAHTHSLVERLTAAPPPA